jgi:D-alanine-D-alanine ligase
MRIGLTYDLREAWLAAGYGEEETAEFDSIETVEAIEAVLHRRGFETERIGSIRDLAARLVAGARWDLVFNFAEGLHGIAREAQVPALLDAYEIPYTFSDPLVLALTLHKGQTKRVVRDAGIATADFAVVESLADIDRIDLPFPLFAKPVAEGSGKGIGAASKVASTRSLRETCRGLLQRFRQPVLVESYLPGREFTVGIAGTGPAAKALSVLEVRLGERAEADAYGYLNKKECHDRVSYRLVDDAEAKASAAVALAAWRALGCRDGGRIDIRSDAAGRPHFLEVNPLAGLHPEHSDLPIMCRLAGIAFDDLIGRIVQSALARVGGRRAAAAE